MIETLIKNIAKALDREKLPYMLIGGQAVLLYGRPRLTKDIDITLGIDVENYTEIERLCDKLKLNIIPKNIKSFVEETKVLPAADAKSKIRVDFIFSSTSYERQAIKRTKAIRIKGHLVKFAAVEDVIIHKMFAGRAIDIEDVKSILIKGERKINFTYIKKWLSRFSQVEGQEAVLENFKYLIGKRKS